MSCCDCCIYSDYIENELICLKDYPIDREGCGEFEHWNSLTEEERRSL
ncbi:MAG: hypothetical protein Q4Q19_03330 [Methanobrevibacter sp.]|nr:hypothetical protein [Methanobrevibacter sp.]